MNPTEVPASTIAMGGESLTVVHVDGRGESVLVRLLPVVKYHALFAVITDEARLAELVCDKPHAWADTLVPASLMDVVEKGTELNFSSARRWAERRAKLDEASLPLAESMAAVQARTSGSSVLTAALRSAGAQPPK